MIQVPKYHFPEMDSNLFVEQCSRITEIPLINNNSSVRTDEKYARQQLLSKKYHQFCLTVHVYIYHFSK